VEFDTKQDATFEGSPSPDATGAGSSSIIYIVSELRLTKET
jgi:hypothetical protein